MARKLKTYQTSLGFFDQAIAAPSMKAALEAINELARRSATCWTRKSSSPRQSAADRKVARARWLTRRFFLFAQAGHQRTDRLRQFLFFFQDRTKSLAYFSDDCAAMFVVDVDGLSHLLFPLTHLTCQHLGGSIVSYPSAQRFADATGRAPRATGR
jgi:hypothetical protein